MIRAKRRNQPTGLVLVVGNKAVQLKVKLIKSWSNETRNLKYLDCYGFTDVKQACSRVSWVLGKLDPPITSSKILKEITEEQKKVYYDNYLNLDAESLICHLYKEVLGIDDDILNEDFDEQEHE